MTVDKWTTRESWDGGWEATRCPGQWAAKCPRHGTQSEIWALRLLTLQPLSATGARTVREGFRQQVAPETQSKPRRQPGSLREGGQTGRRSGWQSASSLALLEGSCPSGRVRR